MLLNNQDLEQLRQQAETLLRKPLFGSSPMSGEQVSMQRGMGVELEDLRPYQIGDDVRHIAWRTTARSNRPITKVFRAERLQRILLIVEQHPGMGFATRGELKATKAAKTAALIAFAALRQRAEIGALVSTDKTTHFPYSNRLNSALEIIGACSREPKQDCTPIAPEVLLAQAQRASRRGDTLFVISDFTHWQPALLTTLGELSENRHVSALQIFDEGEQSLVDVGPLKLRSPFDGSEAVIDTSNAQLRKQYSAAMASKQQELTKLFRDSGITHLRIHTDTDTAQKLAVSL